MKIKKIEIKGLRGIKNKLELNLDSKSCLLFGENGSGKSSITDAIEWFYYNKIKHLSSEEIDKKGITAIRNINIPDNEISYINLEYSDNSFDCKKNIDSKFKTVSMNKKHEFEEYIEQSQKENLILRYADLTGFILSTKKEKLDEILNIIGFDNVLKTQEALKTAKKEVDNRLKRKNFDDEISKREGQILDKLGERIIDDNSFINRINELVAPLGLQNISSISEIDNLINQFNALDDSPIINKCNYLERSKNNIKSIEKKLKGLYERYEEYFELYDSFLNDFESLKLLTLENLLKMGSDIVEKKLWQEDICPLCLQKKNKEELLSELQKRLKEIIQIKGKKEKLSDLKNEIKNCMEDSKGLVSEIERSSYFSEVEFASLKEFIEKFNVWYRNLQKEMNKDLLKLEKIKPSKEILFSEENISKSITFCESHYKELQSKLQGQKTKEINSKISLSWERYKEIKQYKKEREILEGYSISMTRIYNEFVKNLKNELNRFITLFSTKINEYYTFMHPGENISNIQVKYIEEGDNLKGITIEYKFSGKLSSPPQKYLSESHLNSLGLALFLTSVEAFNKTNKFFILDDVISSFDTEHRIRLIDLLVQKFSDYQIIMLTHERDWFNLTKHSVKGRAWNINVIKWSEEDGVYLDPSLIDLRAIIEEKIKNSEEYGLGNLIRQYLEKILKEVSEAIEVKMPYKSNETNERRMCGEMLSYLKSELNKQPCKTDFEEKINTLKSNSLFIGDKGSHFDSFQPSIGDCKSFWDDVLKFQSLFYCSKCNRCIAIKNFDTVLKNIRCECGELVYEWKK